MAAQRNAGYIRQSETPHKERDVKLIASVLAISIAAARIAAAGSFDLKGVELDRTYSDAEIVAKLGRDLGGSGETKFGNSITCNVICMGESRIGTSTWYMSVFKNEDGSIGNLSGHFDAPDYSEIDGLLRQKFGAPTKVTHEAMHNGFGAIYNNTMEIWRSKTGDVIELIHYIDSESGSLSMQSAKNLAEEAAYKKAHAADGKI